MNKDSSQLLNQLTAQLEAVRKKQSEDCSCSDILVQIKAARSLMNTFTAKFLEEQMDKCLCKNCEDKSELKKLLLELTKNS